MAKTEEERLAKKRALILAYKSIFKGKDAELVLQDMEYRFFNRYPTRTKPGQPDYIRDQNEGMRLAWLHIKNRINYNMDDLKLSAEDE